MVEIRICVNCGHPCVRCHTAEERAKRCQPFGSCSSREENRRVSRTAETLPPPPPPTLPPPQDPSAPEHHPLAWALFCTDPDVITFVREKADAVCIDRATTTRLEYEGQPTTIECRVERIDDKAFRRALDVAWRRDENGWSTAARKRAVAVVEEMCR